MGSNDSKAFRTKGDCDSRHKTMRWVTGGIVMFALAGLGSVGGLAMSAYSTANDAKAEHSAHKEFKRSVLQSLADIKLDVRSIRDRTKRIEKNGGH